MSWRHLRPLKIYLTFPPSNLQSSDAATNNTSYTINLGVVLLLAYSPINSTPSPTAATTFTPAQCPDPRRTQRGSRPRGPTPAPSPTAHPTSSPASCNRRTTRSRLSRLHHRPAPMASPRRQSRRSSVCERRHGRLGWLSRARAWTGGLNLGGGLRIARTRAWFIR